jgi:hypothetical protein
MNLAKHTRAASSGCKKGDLESFHLPILPSPDNPSDHENRLISDFMRKSLDSEYMVL